MLVNESPREKKVSALRGHSLSSQFTEINIPRRSEERKRASSRFQWERTRKYHSGDHTGGTVTASDVLKGGEKAAA